MHGDSSIFATPCDVGEIPHLGHIDHQLQNQVHVDRFTQLSEGERRKLWKQASKGQASSTSGDSVDAFLTLLGTETASTSGVPMPP